MPTRGTSVKLIPVLGGLVVAPGRDWADAMAAVPNKITNVRIVRMGTPGCSCSEPGVDRPPDTANAAVSVKQQCASVPISQREMPIFRRDRTKKKKIQEMEKTREDLWDSRVFSDWRALENER